MKNLARMTAAFAALFSFAGAAHASGYGVCADSIGEHFGNLIAPVQSVESLTRINDEISVLLVGQTVIPVYENVHSDLYMVLNDHFDEHGAWIGIVTSVDGGGGPALYMNIWVNTDTNRGCVAHLIGDRVYSMRANAPAIFGPAIRRWEAEHPEGALYAYMVQN